jgi:hypothetical protein
LFPVDFIEKIPPTGKKAKPQGKCAACTIQEKRRKVKICWCLSSRAFFDYCFKDSLNSVSSIYMRVYQKVPG